MTATKALNGFTPSRRYSAGANTVQTRNYRIASGTASNIFTGDLVHLNLGNVSVLGAVDGSEVPIGVFMGCYFEADGAPTFSKHWPANTSASTCVNVPAIDTGAIAPPTMKGDTIQAWLFLA